MSHQEVMVMSRSLTLSSFLKNLSFEVYKAHYNRPNNHDSFYLCTSRLKVKPAYVQKCSLCTQSYAYSLLGIWDSATKVQRKQSIIQSLGECQIRNQGKGNGHSTWSSFSLTCLSPTWGCANHQQVGTMTHFSFPGTLHIVRHMELPKKCQVAKDGSNQDSLKRLKLALILKDGQGLQRRR